MIKVFAMIISNMLAMLTLAIGMACITKGMYVFTFLLFICSFMCTKFMYDLYRVPPEDGDKDD